MTHMYWVYSGGRLISIWDGCKEWQVSWLAERFPDAIYFEDGLTLEF